VLSGDELILDFGLNFQLHPEIEEDSRGAIRFARVSRYRLGATNDEGWFRGQCRFSRVAPSWGEFYEVEGELMLDDPRIEWREVREPSARSRHFLFYFRDETFECDADDWIYEGVVARLPGRE
jgi:hypothetical protein